MNARITKMALAAAGLTVIVLTALAQPALPPASTAPAAAPSVSRPLVQRLPSPIQHFRELLAMNEPERENALSKRTETQRRVLRAKIQEYQDLPANERELRLRVLELRWYLTPLMHLPNTNRAERLAAIPEEYRKLVEERLEQWDLLPPPLQKEVLESETTRNYFIRLEAGTPGERQAMLERLPLERRQQLEENLARWQNMKPGQRLASYHRFDQFFELTPDEKNKVLHTMPEDERRQMEQVLATFQNLPRAQRQYYIESFHKLATLPPAERDEFLKNAARWQAMSPAEREAWREMVTALPPLPPEFVPTASIAWPALPPGHPGSATN